MILQLVNIGLLLSHLFLHFHLDKTDRELSCVLVWREVAAVRLTIFPFALVKHVLYCELLLFSFRFWSILLRSSVLNFDEFLGSFRGFTFFETDFFADTYRLLSRKVDFLELSQV